MDDIFKEFKLACKLGDYNIVKNIIHTNPSFIYYKPTDNDDNLLMWACFHKYDVEIINILLSTGNAHPEHQNKYGKSALMYACRYNNNRVVELLLATGNAHPEYRTTKGKSAIIMACYYNDTDSIKLILQTGNAHPEYQTNSGDSALIWACERENTEIVELLLQTGNAHPEYQTKSGDSALTLVCYNNNIDIVRLLLQTGNAHPEYQNEEGKSAIDYGNDEIKKCVRLYINYQYIIRKIKLIVKVVRAFKNYDRGKPYSCEMFYLMGQDGIAPPINGENIEFGINNQQLKFLKLGYEETII